MTGPVLCSRLAWIMKDGARRAPSYRMLHVSVRSFAAQEFTMPAMSPTMTEGNITNWKIKEGDTFSAGDVLLEIETDKAQMDVEAQDEGVMAKVVEQAGAKGVKVGTRIAVIADVGDDLQSLDIPPVEASPKAHSSGKTVSQTESETLPSSGKLTRSENDARYPLFPSVSKLLHENGLNDQDMGRIAASGPNGRLLKGDVLAYIGTIGEHYPMDQSERIRNLGRLDLSKIERRPSSAMPLDVDPSKLESTSDEVHDSLPTAISKLSLPVYLGEIEKVRHRIHKVLGVDVPLKTFIDRAIERCNENLPRSMTNLTTDDLFDAILGFEKIDSDRRGPNLVPQIHHVKESLSPTTMQSSRKLDTMDELLAPSNLQPPSMNVLPSKPISSESSIFSVNVPAGDEARGKVFLQRLKTVLQVDPGRLVF